MHLRDVVSSLDVEYFDPPYGEFTIARILKATEGRKTPVFRGVGDGFTGVGNLVDTRAKLFAFLGVSSDEEAYTKLLSAVENPGRAELVSTWRDMYREVDSLRKLPWYATTKKRLRRI